jgi:hypothetical protein
MASASQEEEPFMRLSLIVAATIILAAWSSLAFAQFPPPGIYHCTSAAGAPVGTLSLLADGDYQFSVAADASFKEKPGDPGNGKGQIASASTAVTAMSGPLATVYHWKGSFVSDAHRRHTRFTFTAGDGQKVMCGR